MSPSHNQLDPHVMVYAMPRPAPDLLGQTLEYAYLLGATLWMGSHASSTLLTAPLIARAPQISVEMAGLLVWLLETQGFVAAIAAGVLLLAVLGLHLLRMRRPVTILLMLFVVLTMTVLAIGPQVWLIPKLASQIRLAGLQGEPGDAQAQRALVLGVRCLGLMGTLHLFFGAILVALSTRRAYRYPSAAPRP